MEIFDNYGNPDCPHEINSNLLACERLHLYINGNSSSSYNYGHTFEHTKLNKQTMDVFKKIIHNKPTKIADRYEALLGGTKRFDADDGSYISFEHSQDKNGDRFDRIIYRHCIDGKTVYIKSYSNEDVALIAQECPDHPMLTLLAQTLQSFNSKPKQKATDNQPTQPGL